MSDYERHLADRERSARASALTRFLGGSPAAVATRLALLSILVGVVMTALGLDPWNIVESIQAMIRAVWEMGFDAVRSVWRYFLLGAAVVIPVWLVARLMKGWR